MPKGKSSYKPRNTPCCAGRDADYGRRVNPTCFCYSDISAFYASSLHTLLGAAMAMNFFAKPNNFGMLLLAVWLILFGILTAPFLKFNFAHSADLLAVLAIAAGVLLLMKR